MTATAADALRMLAPSTPDTWPAGILVAADLRQARAEAATAGRWEHEDWPLSEERWQVFAKMDTVATDCSEADAEHIAAEANPAHALAAVRHWRGTVERHVPKYEGRRAGPCAGCERVWPCADLTEVADEVRAYLSGAS